MLVVHPDVMAARNKAQSRTEPLYAQTGPKDIKKSFFKSTDHEVYPVHKSLNANNYRQFSIYEQAKYNI